MSDRNRAKPTETTANRFRPPEVKISTETTETTPLRERRKWFRTLARGLLLRSCLVSASPAGYARRTLAANLNSITEKGRETDRNYELQDDKTRIRKRGGIDLNVINTVVTSELKCVPGWIAAIRYDRRRSARSNAAGNGVTRYGSGYHVLPGLNA